MSEQVFELISLCTNTDIKSLSPLVKCFIYYTLLEVSPRAPQPLLQVCHSQNVVINQIKFSSVRWVISQSIDLLKDVNFINSSSQQ